jgi:hypothetical protein
MVRLRMVLVLCAALALTAGVALATAGDGNGGNSARGSSTWTARFSATDLVISVPYAKRPKPRAVRVDADGRINRVDLYTIIDRSGSMSAELNTLKSNLAGVVDAFQCPPDGTGDPAACIDLWAGAGTVGYSGSGAAAFQSFLDLQPNPNYAFLPSSEPTSTNTLEPLSFAVHATITGEGGADYGLPDVPSRATCSGSPANNAGFATFGYACFRAGALPVVVLATDEPPLSGSDTVQNPNWAPVVRDEMLARGARLVGLIGANAASATEDDFNEMATDTRAVDATNGNAPLVFHGADANAATALSNGIHTLVDGLPLDLHAAPVDDPSDGVDTVAAFVDHVEVEPHGGKSCPSGLATADADADGYAESYVDVLPGTILCWRLVAKNNVTVPPTSSQQVFHATISIDGDGLTGIAQRDISFVVPSG